MKQLLSVDDSSRWTPGIQGAYIKNAQYVYEQKAGNPNNLPHWRWNLFRDEAFYEPPHKIRESLVLQLYEEGRIAGLLRIGFHEFRRAIVGDSRKRVRTGHGRLFYRTGVVEWKPSSKFRKSKLTGKKHRDEIRADWRKKKGFDRRRCSYRRGCPHFVKNLSARFRRAHERQVLHRADWDNCVTEARRDFIDPWMWD